ncbi:MAG: DUF6694 family lipoprotein [Pseudomonadota bacterium]
MRAVIVLILGLALMACEKTVDASDPESFRESISEIVAGLSEEKKEELRQSMIVLAFDTYQPSKGIWSGAAVDAPILLAAKDEIEGLSADEIISLGQLRRNTLIDTKIGSLASELNRQKKARAENSELFDKLKIDNPKYRIQKSMFVEQPIISFRITNETTAAIRKIFVNGVLASPERSIPWVEDGFNYEFSGGLEPGESRALDLSPNMFGEWAIDDQFSRRDDLELTLDLFNVELADGTRILDEDARDPSEIEREMAELQELRDRVETEPVS